MLLYLSLILTGCNKNGGNENSSLVQSDSLKSPEKQYLTELQLQDQIDKEIREVLSLANDERINDAIEIISLTEDAVRHILDSAYTDALANLEDAIGKAAVMTAARPDLGFYPLDVNITVRDLVSGADAISAIGYEADKLTDKGYLQAARHLLKDLASEIEISTPMLPVATYPVALTKAAKLLNEDKPQEALILLNTALSTVFIETKYIPLPILRAERMLEEVETLLDAGDRDTDINTLLDNADYQIRFAEALGYGKRDKEFGELYNAIKDIRKEIKHENDGESTNQIIKLRKKLNSFRKRISEDKNQ